MKLKTHISLLSACRIRFQALKQTAIMAFFMVLVFIAIPSAVKAQDVVYWSAFASNGEWDWGTDCTSAGTDGNWHYTTNGFGERKRPDCSAQPNTVYFDNLSYQIMNLNSVDDYTLNQIQFISGTNDRTFNTDASRSIWFKQNGASNAKIENRVSGTIHTFNVDIHVEDLSTWMEFNPVDGDLVFNNLIENRSGNTLHIYGSHKVSFTGNITSTTGTPGFTINNTATVVYSGVSKTYAGPTTINSGATLQISSDQTLGDMVLNTGGTLLVDAGTTLTLTGTWTGGGTIINNGTIILTGPAAFPGSTSTVTSMYNLTVNRVAGVTLDKPVTVTNTFTLTDGICITTGNLLTIANPLPAGISGGSPSSYISGPVLWNLPSNLLTGSTYTFPVGKSDYYPMSVINPTTGTGAVTLQGEAFTGSTGGSPAAGSLATLSSSEYWSLISTGNLTNHSLSLTRQIALGTNNRIGRSTTLAGTYTSIGGTPSGNSVINSDPAGGGTTQYFVMAKNCVAPDVPTLTASINPICAGSSTTLSISTGNLNDAAAWEWYTVTCGGTTAGSGSSIVLSPGTTTTYYARGEGGCAVPGICNSIEVTVNTSPAITTEPVATSACVGSGTATFSVIATGTGLSYQWRRNGVPLTNTAPYSDVTTSVLTITNPVAGAAGNFDVVVSGTCSPSVTSITAALTVNALPTITSAATTTNLTATFNSVCYSNSAQTTLLAFSATTESPTSYNITWSPASLPAVTNASLPASPITISVPASTAANTYTGTLTVKNANGCVSTTRTFTVKVDPTSVAGMVTGPASPICQGNTATLNVTGYVGTIRWIYSATGGASNGTAPAGFPPASPTYNTQPLNATTWFGTKLTSGSCPSLDSPWFQVTVLGPVSPVTIVSPTPTSPCPYVPGLKYSVTNIPGTTYTWTVPDGWMITVGQGTNLITVTSGGSGQNGSINVVATNTCGTTSSSIDVLVLDAPVANVTADFCIVQPNIQLTANPGPTGYTYLWSTGATTRSIPINTGGVYKVTVKDNTTLCTSSATPTVSNELVTNGDFELGNFGFNTDYIYKDDVDGNTELSTGGLPTYLNGEGNYGIGNNPQNYHYQFWGRDHTSNSGNFMIVNGVPGPVVWKQTNITVKPNTQYFFSAWGISLSNNPVRAFLQFKINGVPVGTDIMLNPGPSTNNPPYLWEQFYGTWNSGALTSATLEIIDKQNVLTGNDFGLDDISFGTLQPDYLQSDAAANGGDPVCAGGTINLSVSVTGGLPPYTYAWTGPSGFTSTVQNPSIANAGAANNGTYTVIISDGYGCNPATKTAVVTVLPMPTASITGSASLCKDATSPSITFNAIGSATSPYTFNYTLNGGAEQSIPTISGNSVTLPVSTAIAGDYTYTLTRIESANGCSQLYTSAATVTVKDVTATITGTIGVCMGAASPDISFTGAGWRSSPPYTFTYKINGVLQPALTTVSDRCISIAAPTGTSGTFVYELVSVSAASGCSFPASGSATITVYPAPIITGTNAACVNQTGNIYTTEGGMTGYTWSITGGTITSATNTNTVTVNWGAQGVQTIRVNYTNTHGCAAASPTIFTVYVGNMWTGATNNDWNIAGNWCENSVPDASKDVVIATVPGNPQPQIFSTTAISGNLALADPTASLTINAGQALTVNGNLTNTGGTFTINSSALNNNGSLIVKGTTSIGNVIYKRFLTPSENRWFIASSPVNTSSGGFDGTNVKYDVTYSSFDFAPYIEANNYGWDYQTALPLSLTNGKGYLTRVIGTGILNFTGPLNNTNVSIAVTGSSSYGWNAVGNPFTSAIGITENALSTENFLFRNSSVLDPNYQAIYLWYQTDGTLLGSGSYTPGDQYYRTINNSGYSGKAYGGPVPENNIQAGQGFLINVSSNGNIIFTKNNSAGTAGMQLHSPVITMKSNQTSWPGLTLLASNSGRTRSTVVAFNGNMTNGLDPSYDAGLLSVSDFNLYTHLVDGSTETNFTIQCLPGINYSTYSVPVGIDMPVPGKVTFKVTGLILPEGIYPVIEDRLQQKSTALKTESDSLTVDLTEPNRGTGRFYLHFGETLVVTTDNNLPPARQLTANYSAGIITLFGSPETGSKAWLYDVNGRKLGGEFHLTSENQNEIPAANLASGIYLLRIEGKASRQTIKITVLNR